ncbi:hypothetical protein JGY68_002168 [Salmonella enterica]|nr:hypothetical protein [Salmonella enterica]
MASVLVELKTPTGINLEYPSYSPQSVELGDDGASLDGVYFAPFDGEQAVTVGEITVTGDDGAVAVTVDASVLRVGDALFIPAGGVTAVSVTPQIRRGAPFMAAVRVRQMLAELMGDAGALYAMQTMPEPDQDFSAVYVSAVKQPAHYIDTGWEGNQRFYDYSCVADALVIRNATTAQEYLQQLTSVLGVRRGQWWQSDRDCAVMSCDAAENTSPLLDALVYQQQATLKIKLSFVYRHYEQEGWIDGATVSASCYSACVKVSTTGESQ